MELDKRSRVWIITFPWDGDVLTDSDIPLVPSVLIHSKFSKENESVSVFVKTSTLKTASWITNWFPFPFVVIKRSAWDQYSSFKDIPSDQEIIRDDHVDQDGITERNVVLDAPKEHGFEHSRECSTRTRSSDSSGEEERFQDLQELGRIRKRIKRLDTRLGVLAAKHQQYLRDVIDLSQT